MKKCSKCSKNLNETHFSPANGGRYLRPECKECANTLSKKRKDLKKKYGYPNENYKCPICNRDEKQLEGTGGNAGIWVVDHNHKNNKFRGHICHQCNRGIGLFKDDIAILRRCIEYLQNSNISREE